MIHLVRNEYRHLEADGVSVAGWSVLTTISKLANSLKCMYQLL
jgi:hypothetical protein